ncbi:hypothetical protein DEM27_15455 [Metarhizobium album]|uniref:Uncharacterized protein n=2 Tax=Metarhizobium album TaxID=2182425 RepID=A0A2U2DQK9_9HYPH|nr:hypothetical protein DEM27_15455 [Rhizobium album]
MPEIRGGDSLWPILMEPDDIISVKEAMFRADLDHKAVRRLCKMHAIARQTGRSAPLQISGPAFEMVISGDMVALELLRANRRDHPRVQRYFDHLGISHLQARERKEKLGKRDHS